MPSRPRASRSWGTRVVGVDVDPHKLEPLERGVSPIVEPGLDELVATGSRVRPTSRVIRSRGVRAADADVVLVSVGTPARSDGTVDLGFVERVTEELGAVIASRSSFLAIVYRSTVPPGRSTAACARSSSEASGREADDAFGIGMVPEFLREGSGVADFFDPPFTVAGVRDDRTLDARDRTCSRRSSSRSTPLSIEAAESLKYACNAYHAVKITFANEIGRLLSAVDVDARDVMRVFCEDRHLNVSAAYLRPGFSFGGSCLPKDLRALMHIARIDRRRPADARRRHAEQRVAPSLGDATHPRHGRARRRAARAELQAADRRPAREPVRRARRVPGRERARGQDLRSRSSSPTACSGRTASTSRSTFRTCSACCAPPRRRPSTAPASRSSRPPIRTSSALFSPHRPRVVLDLHGSVGPELEALPGYSGIAW